MFNAHGKRDPECRADETSFRDEEWKEECSGGILGGINGMRVVSAYNVSSIRLSWLGQVEERVERCSCQESKTSHAGGFGGEARMIAKKSSRKTQLFFFMLCYSKCGLIAFEPQHICERIPYFVM